MGKRRVLAIIVAVCVGSLILIGLAIDFRRIWIERSHLARAVDGAAVAGVGRFPSESALRESALGYLQLVYDDQDWEKVRVVISTGDSTEVVSGSSEADAVMTIWIDTAFSRDLDAENLTGTSNRVRVRIRKQVPMTFLRIVGIGEISIEDSAEAEPAPPMVMVVVADVSGAVKFGALCFGCLEEGCTYQWCWSECDVEDAPNHCAAGGVGDAVLTSLDEAESDELASLLDGMRKGIALLSSRLEFRGQPRAVLMILLADRNPSAVPADEPWGQECWQEDLWTSDEGEEKGEQRAADCAIHYAREAERNGIAIYTISLGDHVSRSLMEEIADVTGRSHGWAFTYDELDDVFDELFYRGGARITE